MPKTRQWVWAKANLLKTLREIHLPVEALLLKDSVELQPLVARKHLALNLLLALELDLANQENEINLI